MNTIIEVCLSNAVVATGLALVAVAVGRVCRRPPLRHTLWLLVLLKLITPPIVRIPIVWVKPPASPTGTDLSVADQVPNEADIADISDRLINPGVDEGGAFGRSERSDGPGGGERGRVIVFASSGAALSSLETGGSAATSSATEQPIRRISSVAAFVSWYPASVPRSIVWTWLVGSAVWFSLAVYRISRFHYALRHGRPAGPALTEMARIIARRLGLARYPELWLVPGRISPLLWAIGKRARLVLPWELIDSLQPDQQSALLAHELAHARRRDHWVRWVEFVAIGFYWWNPVTWWARKQLRQSEEQCCDAWVVWALPGRARAYAEALLETVAFLTCARRVVPPVASGIGHAELLRRRLTMILRDSPRPLVSWRTRLVALALGLGVLPWAPYRSTVAADPNAQIGEVETELAIEPADERDDLERRLDALEQKMERLLRAFGAPGESNRVSIPGSRRKTVDAEADANVVDLESARPRPTLKKGANAGSSSRSDAERAAKDALERAAAGHSKAAKTARQAAQKAREAEEAARARATKGKEKVESLERAAQDEAADSENSIQQAEEFAELGREIAEAVREALDPDRMAELGRLIGETVSQNIDPEQMAELGRQIGEAVSRSFESEDIEDLARQIEEVVNEQFSPERMEALERQIEEIVTSAIDTERIEAMAREIEEKVQKSFDAEKIIDLERQFEKALRKNIEVEIDFENVPRAKPAAPKAPTPRTRKTVRPPGGEDDTQRLERRMKALEDKMDRLLETLESSSARP